MGREQFSRHWGIDSARGGIKEMIVQTEGKAEVRKLLRRREELRDKLREHFGRPIPERNYAEFEKIVDELDCVRRSISAVKLSRF